MLSATQLINKHTYSVIRPKIYYTRIYFEIVRESWIVR